MKKLFIICFFILFTTSACSENPVNPELIAISFDGKTFDLSQKKDKIVVLMFWAEWCGYCAKEMPVLDEIYKKYKSRGVEVFGVSTDEIEKFEKVRSIAAKVSYPNSMKRYVTKNGFGFPRGFPTSYIISKGQVIGTIKGYLPFAEFEQRIIQFIK